jgi:hypothetical protein
LASHEVSPGTYQSRQTSFGKSNESAVWELLQVVAKVHRVTAVFDRIPERDFDEYPRHLGTGLCVIVRCPKVGETIVIGGPDDKVVISAVNIRVAEGQNRQQENTHGTDQDSGAHCDLIFKRET